MPWNETHTMDQRDKFISDYMARLFTMTELCERYGISRKTGYKWRHRFDDGGRAALYDQSRAPLTCPHRTPEPIEALLLDQRQAHPLWGPLKLLERVLTLHPDLASSLPAPSTVAELLRRNGMLTHRRRRNRYVHPGAPPLQPQAPNDVWCADFKGEFPTRNGAWCFPFTLTDAYSRYLLSCAGLTGTGHRGVLDTMERIFHEVGLPRAIRTDNGPPFGSVAICGLSQLSKWWIKHGIRHQRIRPGKPQENGRHERMHRTLKAHTARPPAENLRRQQERFDVFRAEYNQIRPHQAIDQQTPATLWSPSPRPMPSKTPEPQYAGHMLVRKVRCNGTIKYRSREIFLTNVLAHDIVALDEIDDGVWSIYFYDTLIARFDERTFKVSDGAAERMSAEHNLSADV
jgi:putative transposase